MLPPNTAGPGLPVIDFNRELEAELTALGPKPTPQALHAKGVREATWLTGTLDAITGAGRVLTLIIAETIQSGAAIVIACVFALLEYWRVDHGAIALGQNDTQAGLIAFAVVTANIVHPIYSLRSRRNQGTRQVKRQTLRGLVGAAGRRVFAQPTVEPEQQYHNPMLKWGAFVITWATIFLAVYDILGPLLTQIFTGQFTRPVPIMLMELVMGFGLSVAGVLFLQASAHEIGVRILHDQPKRMADLLADKEREWREAEQRIRAEWWQRLQAEQEKWRAARVEQLQAQSAEQQRWHQMELDQLHAQLSEQAERLNNAEQQHVQDAATILDLQTRLVRREARREKLNTARSGDQSERSVQNARSTPVQTDRPKTPAERSDDYLLEHYLTVQIDQLPTVRDLAEWTNVSVGTAAGSLNRFKDSHFSTNGHAIPSDPPVQETVNG